MQDLLIKTIAPVEKRSCVSWLTTLTNCLNELFGIGWLIGTWFVAFEQF
ncbi:hypothetical protein [Leptodesmis sichuanensis]|nr:hypothetical protein [Leptodesmis sichuanensis]UIE38956.1 hypothetical protein KIK02_04950 [Leptodesmis sichuanensis A121]